jgi:hypothetical protein
VAREEGYVKVESTAVDGVIDLSAPVMLFGSVAAALTTPYVRTAQSLTAAETVAQVVLATKEIASDLTGGEPP